MRRKFTRSAYKRWLKLKIAKKRKKLARLRAYQQYINSLPKKPKEETFLERLINKKQKENSDRLN